MAAGHSFTGCNIVDFQSSNFRNFEQNEQGIYCSKEMTQSGTKYLAGVDGSRVRIITSNPQMIKCYEAEIKIDFLQFFGHSLAYNWYRTTILRKKHTSAKLAVTVSHLCPCHVDRMLNTLALNAFSRILYRRSGRNFLKLDFAQILN